MSSDGFSLYKSVKTCLLHLDLYTELHFLTGVELKGKEGVVVPVEVVGRTADKYREACEMLTGGKLPDVCECAILPPFRDTR